MNSEWRDFLINHGAEMVDDAVVSFGNLEQERHVVTSGNVICDLSHLSILEVNGEDSADFLQNLLTNDIKALEIGNSQFSGWCTPKGRLLVLFKVVRVAQQRFLLLLPRELVDEASKKLTMFIFRSKVTIQNISENVVRIGLAGPQAETLLEGIARPEVPREVDQGAVSETCTIVRLPPGPNPRFLVMTQLEPAKKIWSHFHVKAAAIGQGSWELIKIRSGIPSVFAQTRESFVPQMINLQNVNGLSFTKGCYPGQEVVARMEYLGKLKRKMYPVFIHDKSTPTAGSTLYSKSSTSAQGAGKVVSIERNGDGDWEGLAVIENGAVEADDLTLNEDGTVAVTLIH